MKKIKRRGRGVSRQEADRYFFLTGILFALIGFVHLFRIANQWQVVAGEWVVPMWLSWVVVILAAYLVHQAWHRVKG